MPPLEAGQPAPAFSLPRDGGGTLDLADYAGRIVVVFFYPKDDTSGCTKEAIGFTERMADFEAAGAAVIGISKDSVKSHDKFKAKHELAMPLLSTRSHRWRLPPTRSLPASLCLRLTPCVACSPRRWRVRPSRRCLPTSGCRSQPARAILRLRRLDSSSIRGACQPAVR